MPLPPKTIRPKWLIVTVTEREWEIGRNGERGRRKRVGHATGRIKRELRY